MIFPLKPPFMWDVQLPRFRRETQISGDVPSHQPCQPCQPSQPCGPCTETRNTWRPQLAPSPEPCCLVLPCWAPSISLDVSDHFILSRQKRNKQHEKNKEPYQQPYPCYSWLCIVLAISPWFLVLVSTLRPVALIGISNAHGTRQARSDEGTQFVDFWIASQQGLRWETCVGEDQLYGVTSVVRMS